MTPLIYRIQDTTHTTTNPIIANRWYEQGEVIEVVDNSRVISVWVQEKGQCIVTTTNST